MSVRVPPTKRGWMKKQGRKGIIKNWKTRYFILEAGKIKYYVDKLDVEPYGSDLKGELSLSNTEVVDDYKKANDCQIYVQSYNGENNMLMETETEAQCREWTALLKQHCQFADALAEDTVVSKLKEKRTSVTGESLKEKRTSVTGENLDPSPKNSFASDSSRDVPVDVSSSTNSNHTSPVSSNSKRTSVTVPVPTPIVTPSPVVNVPVPVPVSTTATSTATGPSKRGSIAVEVNTDGPSISPFDLTNQLTDGIAEVLSTVTNTTKRNEFIKALTENTAIVLKSVVKNCQEGDLGKRGEEWFVLLFVLSFLVIVGVGQYLYALISLLIRVSSVGYILVGVGMIASSLWELKANTTPFIYPTKDNVLVTQGIYAHVRHPMYGGLILFCIGRSIIANSMVKLLLTVVFAFVIDIVSQIEESFLNKAHTKRYKDYSRTKKKLIPFLY